MAGTNVIAATSLAPKVLYSGRLTGTSGVAVYTVPASQSAIVKHGTVCNTSAATVNVTVGIVPSGGTFDGTHTVISAYTLAAGDTLPLADYLAGACLSAGDMIYVQASVTAVLTVILTGVESS